MPENKRIIHNNQYNIYTVRPFKAVCAVVMGNAATFGLIKLYKFISKKKAETKNQNEEEK